MSLDTLRAMLSCCEAWEPTVCIMGNVRAGDAAEALRAALAEASVVNQQLTTEAEPVAWSEEVMRQWDGVRKAIAKGDTSSWPRDWFESLAPPTRRELERELAAVTAERDALRAAFTPRGWTRAQSDAWHRALPDTERAFRALHEASVAAGG